MTYKTILIKVLYDNDGDHLDPYILAGDIEERLDESWDWEVSDIDSSEKSEGNVQILGIELVE